VPFVSGSVYAVARVYARSANPLLAFVLRSMEKTVPPSAMMDAHARCTPSATDCAVRLVTALGAVASGMLKV